MIERLSKAAAVAILATGAAVIGAMPASAASAPLSDPRIAMNFNLSEGQTPENLTLAPHGNLYVTFSTARQVAEVSPATGAIRVLVTMPLPADGGVDTPILGHAMTLGIVRASDGTLYFLYAAGTADLTGVWKMIPGRQPERIAALPADSLPNGLALDPATNTLYIADSALSTVWSVPASGGTTEAWATSSALAGDGSMGANGLKVHDGAVWVTDTKQGTLLRIPILPNRSAGPIRTVATGLTGIDDFIFTGHDNQILAALDSANEVAVIGSDGSSSLVMTAADGLEGPSSIALRGDTVYIMSAAYRTQYDPNLIVAHLKE
jgi:sugar lactone lactonase YvrE